MTSKVEICSNALLLIGHAPIANLTESDRAVVIGGVYDQVRRATLRAHVWNFAKARALLSPLATPPAFEWAGEFALPGDCLRPLYVGDPGVGYEYEIEGRSILANEGEIRLRYLRDVDDPNTFDASFVDALCANLAFTVSFTITKSLELQKAMFALYTEKKREAKVLNDMEEPPSEIQGSVLLDARRRR